jgi:hypothetical protein
MCVAILVGFPVKKVIRLEKDECLLTFFQIFVLFDNVTPPLTTAILLDKSFRLTSHFSLKITW